MKTRTIMAVACAVAALAAFATTTEKASKERHYPAAAKFGENEIRLYAQSLRYEVLKDGVVVVPPTQIDVQIDGSWILENAAIQHIRSESRGVASEATPIYKKGAIDTRRNETLVDFGDAAGITNRDARDFEFKTDFLDDGEWKAEMFIDDKESDRQPTKYIHTTGVIKKGDAFKAWMAEGGGFIVRFSR